MHNHKKNAKNQSVDEQASSWFARMQADDVSSTELERFNQWLKQSQAHKSAYDNLVNLWGVLKQPAQNVQATLQIEESKATITEKQSTLTRSIPVFLVLLLLIIQLPGFYQNWRSDYHTTVGEQLNITLNDGTQVLLNTDSALVVNYSAHQRQVELLRGEAFFDVESDKARPFVVVHHGLSAKAVGTAFTVKVAGLATQVVVSEGIVELSAEQTDRLLLTKNQKSKYQQGRRNLVEDSKISEEFAWQRGQLVFNQQPLASVIAEVNRYRKGRIVIINPNLKQRVVSGVFDTVDTNAVVAAITSTLRVKSLNMADQLVLIY